MKEITTFDELVQRVEQQGNTVVQLVKIIAETNHRVSELQIQQKEMRKDKVFK